MTNNTSNSAACGCRDGQECVNERGSQDVKTGSVRYQPPMDVYQFEDRYEVVLDLPGATAEQIAASIDGDVLTVEARVPARYSADIKPLHGEYGVGDFHRQVRVGEDIDAERLSARFEHGVLTVSLPKRPERQPRRIRVTGG